MSFQKKGIDTMEIFGFGRPNIKKMKDARDVKGLIKALGYQKDSAVVAQAARALKEIGTPAVELLIAALKDHKERDVIANVLRQIDAPAVESLIALLKHENSRVRLYAIESLGRIGDTRAVEPLITALENVDSLYDIAIALGAIRDPRAIEPLLRELRRMDRNGSHAFETVAANLRKLGWSPSQDEIGAIYYAGLGEWDKCIEIGALAVEPLVVALLKNTNWRRDWGIISALEEIGDISAAEPLLIANLDGSDAVAIVLGKMGNSRAIEPLITILRRKVDRHDRHSDDESKQIYAALALGRIGEPAIEPLIAALENGDIDPKFIESILSKIGASAVEPLIAMLKHTDANIRTAAATALGEIGDTRAIEPLLAILLDGSGDVRSPVAYALDALGWKPNHDEIGARFFIALRRWKDCLLVGVAAIEPLTAVLKVMPAGWSTQVEVHDPTAYGSYYDGVRLTTEYTDNPDYAIIEDVLRQLNESAGDHA